MATDASNSKTVADSVCRFVCQLSQGVPKRGKVGSLPSLLSGVFSTPCETQGNAVKLPIQT